MRGVPDHRDLFTDVSFNFEMAKKVPAFDPAPPPEGGYACNSRHRARQEFRKCIECFMCQDVCHVIRDHGEQAELAGPRFFIASPNSRCTPRHQRPGTGQGAWPRDVQHHECCTELCPDIKITDTPHPHEERVSTPVRPGGGLGARSCGATS